VEWMVSSKGAHREDGMITYQWAKQQAARQVMRDRIRDWPKKTFVDVGAHVGLWSMWWAPIMKTTVAFEPIPDMAILYHQNMKGRGNYHLLQLAVGARPGQLNLAFNPKNTGNTHKAHKGTRGLLTLTVPMTTVDRELVALKSPPVGAMKVDCEGTELAVLQGAAEMIERDRPVIIVEQKKGAEYYGYGKLDAVDYLKAQHGYEVIKAISGDYIMALDGA
jgi:FkbM family methyltransferase